MDNFRIASVCGQVTLVSESEDEKKNKLLFWTDPNCAVELARKLLDRATEEGATNVEDHFPEPEAPEAPTVRITRVETNGRLGESFSIERDIALAIRIGDVVSIGQTRMKVERRELILGGKVEMYIGGPEL